MSTEQEANGMKRPLMSAVAMFVGTVVGAGIFALPYGFSRAGFIPGLLLLIFVGVLMYILHLAYGEVVLRTHRVRQMRGLAGKYVGPLGKSVATFTMMFGGYGAMLAYIIGVGTFLHFLLSEYLGGNIFLYSTIFFVLASLAVLFGLRAVAAAQQVMLLLLLAVLVLFLVTGVPHIELPNLSAVGSSPLQGALSLYGLLMFAFVGVGALVDMERILSENKTKMKDALRIGLISISIVYVLFAAVVVGISGSETSSQAVEGLVPFVGSSILVVGALFGMLAMGTSFLVSALYMQELYEIDFKLPKSLAWLAAIGVPYLLYLAGVVDFVRVIEVVGSVVVGIDVILILAMHARAKIKGNDDPPYSLRIPKPVRWVMYGVFLFGIGYQLVQTLMNALFS